MRTYECVCGATLFFGNTHCATCQREVGWCDACRGMTSLSSDDRCTNADCGQALVRCANRVEYRVCNCFVPNTRDGDRPLCRSCIRTSVIPNIDEPERVRQWGTMEAAKRRLFYDLDLVGITDEALDVEPPLEFRFMADTPEEQIITGHADAMITINLAEADPVHREVTRQQFGEPQRTVIGHLRHEFAHFIWLRYVPGTREAEWVELFGDHNNPEYSVAMKAYYEQGPPTDWRAKFISQYASAHPWEDFAETAAFYLDMRSVLDTLKWQVPQLVPAEDGFDSLLQAYLRDGIVLNEINRTLGLIDVVPEVVNDVVTAKLRFVHGLLAERHAPETATSNAISPDPGSGTAVSVVTTGE